MIWTCFKYLMLPSHITTMFTEECCREGLLSSLVLCLGGMEPDPIYGVPPEIHSTYFNNGTSVCTGTAVLGHLDIFVQLSSKQQTGFYLSPKACTKNHAQDTRRTTYSVLTINSCIYLYFTYALERDMFIVMNCKMKVRKCHPFNTNKRCFLFNSAHRAEAWVFI